MVKEKKNKSTEVSDEVKAKVVAYVYENYDNLKGLPLRVMQGNNCFYVYKHKDGGPMILGLGVID
jgi:hypothetical protein